MDNYEYSRNRQVPYEDGRMWSQSRDTRQPEMFASNVEEGFNTHKRRPFPPAPPVLGSYDNFNSSNSHKNLQKYDPAFPLDGQLLHLFKSSESGPPGKFGDEYFRDSKHNQSESMKYQIQRADMGESSCHDERFPRAESANNSYSSASVERSLPDQQIFVRRAPPLNEEDMFRRQSRKGSKLTMSVDFTCEEPSHDMFQRTPLMFTMNHIRDRNQKDASEEDIDKCLKSRRNAMPNEIDMASNDQTFCRAPPRDIMNYNKRDDFESISNNFKPPQNTGSDAYENPFTRDVVRNGSKCESDPSEFEFSRPRRGMEIPSTKETNNEFLEAGDLNSRNVFQRKVTHVDGEIGFAGTDLFFQMSKVNGPVRPQVGSLIVVKAERVQSMPFEWNALSVDIVSPLKPQENMGLAKPYPHQLERVEQIPLNLPLAYPANCQASSQAKPLKSILKNNPPPPPVISAPSLPKEIPTYRNRSPSPESPLILFEQIPKKASVSPTREKRKPVRRRSTRSPSSIRRRKSPARSSSPRRYSRKFPSPRHSSRKSHSPKFRSRVLVSPRKSSRRGSRSPVSRRSRERSRSRSRSRSRRRGRRSRSQSPASHRKYSRSSSRDSGSRRRHKSPDYKTSTSSKLEAERKNSVSEKSITKYKPAPVSFTWSKSAKDPPQQTLCPSQSAAQKLVVGKKIKKKEKEQPKAYTVVPKQPNKGVHTSNNSGNNNGAQGQSIEETIRLQREKLQNVKLALQAAVKANEQANKTPAKQLLPNPLFNTKPPHVQSVNAYPVQSNPVAPFPYPTQIHPNPIQPQQFYPDPPFLIPNAYPPNFQHGYPDQSLFNQGQQPYFGAHPPSRGLYPPQSLHQQTSAEYLFPPGESPVKPPTQVYRTTTLSSQPLKPQENFQNNFSANTSGSRNPRNFSFVKNSLNQVKSGAPKRKIDEPLPPGVEPTEADSIKTSSGSTVACNNTQDNIAATSSNNKITSRDSSATVSKNQENPEEQEQDLDEVCTIYVKPASFLFEDAEECEPNEKSPTLNKESSSILSQDDSMDDDDHDIMNAIIAEGLGCHPDKLLLARNWMICTRCAQRGHLIHMCDKARVPRALPFEISMAKDLLKNNRKKHSEEVTNRTKVEVECVAVNQETPKDITIDNTVLDPGGIQVASVVLCEEEANGNPSTTDMHAIDENTIKLWEQERRALKQKKDGKPNVATVIANPTIPTAAGKPSANKPVKTAKAHPQKEKKVASSSLKETTKLPSKSPAKKKVETSQSRKPSHRTDSKSKSQVAGKSTSKVVLNSDITSLLPNPNYKPHGGGDSRADRGVRDINVRSIPHDTVNRRSTSPKHKQRASGSLNEPVVRISRRRSRSPNVRRSRSPNCRPTMITGDPMTEVAVKQLEIQSLDLRDRELKQAMELIKAKQGDMHSRNYVEGSRQEYGHSSRSQLSSAQDLPFCYVCFSRGHRPQDCRGTCPTWLRDKIRVPEGFVVERNRGELEPLCLACGKCGHFTRTCHSRNPYESYSDDEH